MAEILVIAVIALLVFGPERLPELARNAGKALARFKAETSKSVEELRRAADATGLDADLRGLAKDMKGVRDTVRNPVRSVMDELTRAATVEPRAADKPPPTDPEAT